MKYAMTWVAECRGGPMDGERLPVFGGVPGYTLEVVVYGAWEYEVSFVWQGVRP